MDARYAAGVLLGETFFDGEGRGLRSDGSLRPPRPAGVPADVGFEESSGRWVSSPHDVARGTSHGTSRAWRQDGTLCEEIDWEDGKKAARRGFDARGELLEQAHFLAHEGWDDIPQGRWWRRFEDGGAAGFADVRARAFHGHHERGQAVGTWLLEGDDGVVLGRLERGRAFDAGAPSPAFEDVTRTVSQWCAIGARLGEEGRVRESLVALARAAGVSGDVTPFVAALALVAPPRTTAGAAEVAGHAAHEEPGAGLPRGDRVATLLEALVDGGDPRVVLSALATSLDAKGAAARDLCETALRLDPSRIETVVARTLLALERGDVRLIREDLPRLRAASEDTAAFIETYLGLLVPAFDFVPSREVLAELPEEMPIAVAQDIGNVQVALRAYATRLDIIRTALARLDSQFSTILPDVLGILGTTACELRKTEAVIVDHDDQGREEMTKVTVDETVLVATRGMPALMGLARASFTGLAWLCWAVGLDRIGWPEVVAERAAFPRALAHAVARAWRARDAITTSGLRSMTQGVPGFTWEGLEIDAMPRAFAEICADEYLEMRAVMLFLSSPENLSPFQDDLRQV